MYIKKEVTGKAMVTVKYRNWHGVMAWVGSLTCVWGSTQLLQCLDMKICSLPHTHTICGHLIGLGSADPAGLPQLNRSNLVVRVQRGTHSQVGMHKMDAVHERSEAELKPAPKPIVGAAQAMSNQMLTISIKVKNKSIPIRERSCPQGDTALLVNTVP